MARRGQAGSGAPPVPATGWDAEMGGMVYNSLDGNRNVTAA